LAKEPYKVGLFCKSEFVGHFCPKIPVHTGLTRLGFFSKETFVATMLRARAHAHTHTHTHAHTHTHTHTCAHTHAHIHTRIHTHTLAESHPAVVLS